MSSAQKIISSARGDAKNGWRERHFGGGATGFRNAANGAEKFQFRIAILGARGVCAKSLDVQFRCAVQSEGPGELGAYDRTIQAIVRALEKAGVVFIPENGGGAGLRLAKRSKRSK